MAGYQQLICSIIVLLGNQLFLMHGLKSYSRNKKRYCVTLLVCTLIGVGALIGIYQSLMII